jgi:hypothetical protein
MNNQVVIGQEALENLVNLGLTHEEIQRHVREYMAQGGTAADAGNLEIVVKEPNQKEAQ